MAAFPDLEIAERARTEAGLSRQSIASAKAVIWLISDERPLSVSLPA
jgi:hypothetical protein